MIQFLFDHGWIARNQTVVGNVSRDHTTCSYNASVADGYSGNNCYVTTQPTVLPDCDGISIFLFIATLHGIHGMIGGIELTVRPYPCMFTNADISPSKKYTIIINEDIFL